MFLLLTTFSSAWAPVLGVLSAWGMFLQADVVGKVIVMILLGGSIWVWSIMFSKAAVLKRSERDCEGFLQQFRAAEHPMTLYRSVRMKRGNAPLAVVYHQALAAWEAVLDVQGIAPETLEHTGDLMSVRLSDREIHSVGAAAERAVADQVLVLESQMSWLATASSLAPFLGLFGTVWGVMLSFGEMSGSGSALLSEVAPGISSALLTTVVGLLVAIPSTFGYNALSDRIRRLTVQMDNFAQELTGDLERVHRA